MNTMVRRFAALIGFVMLSTPVWPDTGSLAGRLQLGLDLEAYAWAPGGRTPRALVMYCNISQAPLTFDRPAPGARGADSGFDHNQWLLFTDSQGQPAPSDGVGIRVELAPGAEWVPLVTLGSGETYSYCTTLSRWGYEMDVLAPGVYRVQAMYEYFDVPRPTFYDVAEEGQWLEQNHQLLYSNTVSLEILTQGGKAPERVRLVRDGAAVDRALPRIIVRDNLMADARVFSDVRVQVERKSGTATITRGDRRIGLPVGRWSNEMKDTHPPAIPCLEGGLMVPVRYVAESLGMRVVWDPKTKTANILTG